VNLMSNLHSASDVSATGPASGASGPATAHPATGPSAEGPDVSLHVVLRLVAAAKGIGTVPSDLVPPLTTDPLSSLGIPPVGTGCWPGLAQSTVPACVFGDRSGSLTMVLYGDSHAGMWFRALDDIATRAHWKLVVLTKGFCPAAPLSVHPAGVVGEWVACDQWHKSALARINQIDPALLVVSQASADGHYTPDQWRRGLEDLFTRVTAPRTVKLVLGNIPATSKDPDCVARHTDDVQACSRPRTSSETPYNNAERSAAAAQGARYIDVTPWFCATTCSAVIGPYNVYYIAHHVALDYSRFLEGVLAGSLDLAGVGHAGTVTSGP
jgi:SGNH domain (fused to AT3 domains)